MTRQVIVTLAIGEAYRERFERLCRPNWTRYAEKHGFDLVAITVPLDDSARARARSPAWQKCLILSAPETAAYERVVWVDSDIAINAEGPSVVDGVPLERIGATDEHVFPSPAVRQALLHDVISVAPEDGHIGKRYWESWREPGAWHSFVGLPGGQSHIVQTGVLVLSRRHHRELLEHVYHAYEDENSRLFNYEMRPLSHEILARGLEHWIDRRFNALVWWMFLHWSIGRGEAPNESELRPFLNESYRRNYFLHFAGAGQLMGLLDTEAASL